jgi:hypothetical protein
MEPWVGTFPAVTDPPDGTGFRGEGTPDCILNAPPETHSPSFVRPGSAGGTLTMRKFLPYTTLVVYG